MRTPFRVSLVTSVGVFAATALALLLHHDTVNGQLLTIPDHLPTALSLGAICSALALLGTWFGLRRGGANSLTYRVGLAVALLYIFASFLINALVRVAPQSVTFPSREANIVGVEIVVLGTLWGIGAPYGIALFVRRLKFLQMQNVA
jgi:hypothetical protein